jgi:hypothetical protein
MPPVAGPLPAEPLAEPPPDVLIAELPHAELRNELIPAAYPQPGVPLSELLPDEMCTEPPHDEPSDGPPSVAEKYRLAMQHCSWELGHGTLGGRMSFCRLHTSRINRVIRIVCTIKVSDELELKLILT